MPFKGLARDITRTKLPDGNYQRDVDEGRNGEDENEPDPDDYMPAWPRHVATHWQMYESTSEGTPVSPVMRTPHDLAEWLYEHGISTFADAKTDYDGWLSIIEGANAFLTIRVGDDDVEKVDVEILG